jgi:hypothetical protein
MGVVAQDSTEVFEFRGSGRITNVYVATGPNLVEMRPAGLEDFRRLAPESEILSADLSEYDQLSLYFPYPGVDMHAMLGIRFRHKAGEWMRNPELRFGVRYTRSVNVSNRIQYVEKFRFDTLTGAHNTVAYMDSVTVREVDMRYEYDVMRVGASVLFRTYARGRWNIYGGLGMSLGAVLRSYTRISWSESHYEQMVLAYSAQSVDGPALEEQVVETHAGKRGFVLGLDLPLGLDFRLGNKKELLKRMHLYAELRPSLDFQFLKGLGNHAVPVYSQAFGLRIYTGK